MARPTKEHFAFHKENNYKSQTQCYHRWWLYLTLIPIYLPMAVFSTDLELKNVLFIVLSQRDDFHIKEAEHFKAHFDQQLQSLDKVRFVEWESH